MALNKFKEKMEKWKVKEEKLLYGKQAKGELEKMIKFLIS
jgi:hypothetical protein